MRRESGSAAVEMVLVTPVLLAMLLFVAMLGRLASSRADVDAAARDAARAASIARSPAAARLDGERAATAALQASGVTCRQLSVDIDTAAFRAGGNVAATVSCTADLSDLTLLGIPASRRITADFSEPLDAYRGISS